MFAIKILKKEKKIICQFSHLWILLKLNKHPSHFMIYDM